MTIETRRSSRLLCVGYGPFEGRLPMQCQIQGLRLKS